MTTTVESSVQEEAGSVSVECLAKDLGWEGGRDEGTGVLIDVRTPGEYAAVHVAGSESMPLAELDVGEVKRKRDHGETVYVLCGTGKRASNAIAQLVGEGVGGCVLVEGGLAAWEVAGLPVIRGKRKVISLERQVRVAAGFLVLVGVLLGTLVNPAWLILSGFVGVGFVFAGITDTCGMGMLLAKLPWNR